MVTNRMKNPVNVRSMAIWSIPGTLGALIGFIWIYLESGFDWFAFSVTALLLLIYFMALPGRIELIDRPKAVEVTDHGVTLYQRLGRKPVFLPWESMVDISHLLSRSGEKVPIGRNSYLMLNDKGKGYTVDWNVAEVVREEFRKQFGYYPPNRMAEEAR